MSAALIRHRDWFEVWSTPPDHPLHPHLARVVVRKREGWDKPGGSWALRRLIDVANLCLPTFKIVNQKVAALCEVVHIADYSKCKRLIVRTVSWQAFMLT